MRRVGSAPERRPFVIGRGVVGLKQDKCGRVVFFSLTDVAGIVTALGDFCGPPGVDKVYLACWLRGIYQSYRSRRGAR